MQLTLINEKIEGSRLEVARGDSLSLRLASFDEFPDKTIEIIAEEGATINASMADFSKGNGKFSLTIHLKRNATFTWHLASLCNGDDKKSYDIRVYHDEEGSQSLVSYYGICQGEGSLDFGGVSEIIRGAHKSKTRQEAKIIVFDPKCKAYARPNLNIDENDVDASHAAAVGKLSDEHVYYMLSRGLSLSEARRLITLGYLKPIEKYFEDEELIKRIDASIEEGVR